MAAESLVEMAAPAGEASSALKASLEGARMVTFCACDRVPTSLGMVEMVLARVERSGSLARAAVRFIVCAEAVETMAARQERLKYMMSGRWV